MERVLIIGSNGAGKSTFSRALSDCTGLPLVHIDQLYWCGNWEITPPELFASRVREAAEKPRWIIDGNKIGTLAARLPYADTVLWFDFPPLVCLFNILKRELRARGRAREDMPPGCKSRLTLRFLWLAARFNRTNNARIARLLACAPRVRVLRFTNCRQTRRFLRDVRA